MSEIWKSPPSLPEYVVSNLGRVMCLPYEAPMPRGGTRIYGGTIGIGQWSEKERRFVLVFRGKTYRIGRLVCEAFHGPVPFDGAISMHLDENAANNRPSNLQWGTQKENLNAPGFIKYCQGRVGKNNPRIKGQERKVVA